MHVCVWTEGQDRHIVTDLSLNSVFSAGVFNDRGRTPAGLSVLPKLSC